jgi:hypothetical protein
MKQHSKLVFLDGPAPAAPNETPSDRFRRGYRDALRSNLEGVVMFFPDGFAPDQHYIDGYDMGGEAAEGLMSRKDTTVDTSGHHPTAEALAMVVAEMERTVATSRLRGSPIPRENP